MCLLSEAIQAKDALEWSFTRVCSQVDRKICFPAQLAFTHGTQKLFPPVLVRGGVTLFYKTADLPPTIFLVLGKIYFWPFLEGPTLTHYSYHIYVSKETRIQMTPLKLGTGFYST